MVHPDLPRTYSYDQLQDAIAETQANRGVYERFVANEIQLGRDNKQNICELFFKIVKESTDPLRTITINDKKIDLFDCLPSNRIIISNLMIANYQYQKLSEEEKSQAEELALMDITPEELERNTDVKDLVARVKSAALIYKTAEESKLYKKERTARLELQILFFLRQDHSSFLSKLPHDALGIINQQLRNSDPAVRFNHMAENFVCLDKYIFDVAYRRSELDIANILQSARLTYFDELMCEAIGVKNYADITPLAIAEHEPDSFSSNDFVNITFTRMPVEKKFQFFKNFKLHPNLPYLLADSTQLLGSQEYHIIFQVQREGEEETQIFFLIRGMRSFICYCENNTFFSEKRNGTYNDFEVFNLSINEINEDAYNILLSIKAARNKK